MSYKVYAGTQTAIDTWSEKVCIYDPGAEDDTKILLDPVLTREDSKAGSFEATVPLGNIAHSALQKLKDAHKAQDLATVDSAMAELNTAFQAASAEMYAQSGAQGGAQAGPDMNAGQQGGAQDNTKHGDNVQDADFEEVK